MNSKVYFISDIHLQPYDTEEEERKRKYLFEFLEKVRGEKCTLFIVGDLFDFWFEYKHVIPCHYFKTLRYLQKTVEAGCDVHIIVGNHDYWMGDFFPNELGVRIHQHPLDIEISNKRFFIIHGDGILKRDKGYRIMKKFLRSKLLTRLFGLLHPDFAFAIARKVSSGSRSYTLRSPEMEKTIRNEITEYSRNKFKEGYQYIVMGHYHMPTAYRENGNTFLNLGDWMKYFTFGYFDGKELSLCYWKQRPLNSANLS